MSMLQPHENSKTSKPVMQDEDIHVTLRVNQFDQFNSKLHVGDTYMISNVKVVPAADSYKPIPGRQALCHECGYNRCCREAGGIHKASNYHKRKRKNGNPPSKSSIPIVVNNIIGKECIFQFKLTARSIDYGKEQFTETTNKRNAAKSVDSDLLHKTNEETIIQKNKQRKLSDKNHKGDNDSQE